MSETCCPPLEALFDELSDGRAQALEHARSCERCAELLEEHRQLEKDLYRLADPLPPPDFVHQVMAKVAAAPKPVRSEVWGALAILVAALGLSALTFFAGGGNLGTFGVWVASFLVDLREIGVALASAATALWKIAAFPLTAALAVVLILSLLGLRRLAGPRVEAKVSP